MAFGSREQGARRRSADDGRTTMNRRGTRCALVCACAIIALTPSLRADADQPLAEAKRLFNKAEVHFGTGDFKQALELYTAAFQKKPLPGFHFNIAQCHRNLGNHKQAIFHFKQYLARSKNPSNRTVAEQLLQESERAHEQALAASVPSPEEEPPAPALDTEVPADLTQPGKENTPTPSSKTESTTEPTDSANRKGLPSWAFWSGVGVTGALLIAGTITGIMTISKGSKFNDPTTDPAELRGLKDDGETLRTVANISFAGAAVAAVSTAVLYFFTDFSKADRSATLAANIGLNRAVLTLGGSF